MFKTYRKELLVRIARIALSVLLCFTMIPVGAFAEEIGQAPVDNQQAADQTVETAADADQVADPQTENPAEVTEVTEANSTDDDLLGEDSAVNETAPEVTAGTETGEVTPGGEEEPAPVAPAPKIAKSLTLNGLSLKFKNNVLIETPLDSKFGPARAWIKGNKKSIKVSWTKEAASAPIDGYIILRKTGKSKVFKEVKKVSKSTYTYTDKKAKKKNTVYSYTVVGYRREGANIHVSPCSSWAEGLTTNSKLKNSYKATISSKTASLQVGGTVALTAKHKKTKKIHNKKSFRWVSDNNKVAKVSKGKVTAVAPGTTTIRARIASGVEVSCKVTVVGAFKPGKPTVQRDYSTTQNIAIMWSKTKHATSYDVYCSKDNADNYELIANVKGVTYNHTGLEKDHLYSYIVQARNDNGSYKALSDRSNALDLKAVKTPRATRVSGFPAKKSIKAKTQCKLTLKVTAPDSRTATLQEYNGKKWVNTKTTVKLPAGIDTVSVDVTLPDTWWKENSTSWRLVFPKSEGATAFTTGTFKLTTLRYYQNPKKYVQITNKISKHGLSYYTSPVLVNNMSTKKDHIEAMIKTAYKYLGDPYVVCQSRAPGKGVDCSGLVMQACYGAGVDLWPSNPYRHRSPAYEWESRNIAKHSNLKTVPYSDRKRGDLIFYANGSGTVIHVAIYLGNNKIIHSALSGVHVTGMGYKYGHVCKVKRIFN